MGRRRSLSFLPLCVLGAVLASASVASAAPQLRFETTARGRILTTGNTLGLSKAVSENGPGTADSIGTFISLDPNSIDDSPAGTMPWPLGTTNAWANNGSAATLDLAPSEFFNEILYAELVWGGSTMYGSENVSADLDTPVTLAFGADTLTVTPDPATAYEEDGVSASMFDIHYYLRSADVTAFVQEHLGGEYSVSGVPATQDLGINSLNAAGWSLIVVYRNDGELERNLSVFVGGSFVDEDTTEDYSFSGFCTPPTGEVNGRAFISAVEGDASFSGDQLSIAQTVAGPFVALSGPNNPVNNFFGSQINDIFGNLDDRGTFGDFNHDAELATNIVAGRQGWDVTSVAVGSGDGSLNNGQQSAVLRVDTTGDSFLPATVSFEIDVNAPNFTGPDAFSADHDVVYEGDSVAFTLTLTNTGTATAESMILKLPLGDDLTLTSFAIDGVNGDASQMAVDSTDMAVGVEIGDVAPAATKVITFSVDVDQLPAQPDPATFTLLPQWTYDYVTCVGEPAIGGNGGLPPVDLRATRLGLDLDAQVLGDYVIEYTATIDNSGSEATSAANFDLQIPANTTYVAGSTTLNGANIPDVGGESVFLEGGLIASEGESDGVVAIPDGVAVVTFSVLADGPGQVDNSVTADADGPGPVPSVQAMVSVMVDDDGSTEATSDTATATDTDTDSAGETAGGSGDEGTGEDGSASDTSDATASGFEPIDGGGGGDGCDCRADREGSGAAALGLLLLGLVRRRRSR